MQPVERPRLLNNLSLNILAIVFGYTLWKSISEHQVINVTLQAPVSWYGTTGLTVDAPEKISVTLQAKRDELYTLTKTVAAHIDAATLHEGENPIKLNASHFILPESVKLVNCSPKQITIQARKS